MTTRRAQTAVDSQRHLADATGIKRAADTYTSEAQRYWDHQRPIGEMGGEFNRWKFAPYVRPEHVVVDFGCGGGYLLAGLPGTQKIGVDPSPLARHASCTRSPAPIGKSFAARLSYGGRGNCRRAGEMKRLVLVSGATLLAGALFATGSLADPPMTSASEVRWGGRAFFGPAELSEWLSGHGLSYDAWAKNHPRAAARLEGREQRETAPTTAPAASPAASRVASPAPAQATAAPRDASRTSGAFLLRSLATLAAALLVLALLPALHLRQVRLPSVLERHQLELAGGGVAIALALAAAHLV